MFMYTSKQSGINKRWHVDKHQVVILRSAARNLAPVNSLCQRGTTEHGVVAYNKQKKSTGGAWTLAHKVNIGALYNYFPTPPSRGTPMSTPATSRLDITSASGTARPTR